MASGLGNDQEASDMKFLDWIWFLFKKPTPQDQGKHSQGTAVIDGKIENFIHTRLGTQDVPHDLRGLLSAIAGDPGFEKSANNPLGIIGAEILWAEATYPLLDHTYINDVDRADPEVMANVKAMQDNDKKLKFVMQCDDTSLLGYWQPDPDTPLDQCALFWLDTEGQYSLAEGETFSESLAYRALVDGDEDTYRSLRDLFHRLGVTIRETDEARIFAGMDARAMKIAPTPESFRSERYEYYLSLP
jgi:hypothetical protein